jgi:hypothetical protein
MLLPVALRKGYKFPIYGNKFSREIFGPKKDELSE